jgi:predicted kinase
MKMANVSARREPAMGFWSSPLAQALVLLSKGSGNRSFVKTLHLMVGLPGSGKTTLARELETRYSALRLTLDEWHIRLFGSDVHDDSDESDWAKHNALHEAVESLLWEVAARVLTLGVDVILDFSFWVRSQRDELRAKARHLGADFKIHFTDVSEELLLERIRARNVRLPQGTFHIPEVKLREWMRLFEPPSPSCSSIGDAAVTIREDTS